MSDLFIHIYRFFRSKKGLFFFLVALASVSIGLVASRIGFQENIAQSVSSPTGQDKTGYVISHLKTADKLVIDISLADSLAPPSPGGLESLGERLVDSLHARFDTGIIQHIVFRASDTAMTKMMDLVMEHLPVFFEEQDYKSLDSMLLPGSIRSAFEQNYRILISPASIMLKKQIQKDPLGISKIAFAKLVSLRADENFELYDGCVVSRDLRHLLIFIVPANPSNETSLNGDLIQGIDEITGNFRGGPDSIYKVQYFGGPAVAVCNAVQVKKDISLTLLIAFILIFLLTGWYFRSFMVPLMGMLPAIFGGALSLAILFLAKGTISAISLGIGSVILGLIIDYSLYLVNHFRRNRDVELTLRELSLTIVLCSITSAGAFLCLTFLNSAVLQDLGWFAALSVIGAALFTLLILPNLLSEKIIPLKESRKSNVIDKLASMKFEEKRWVVVGLLLAGALSLWFSRVVEFEKDMSALSFVTPQLARAESDLDRISNYKLKNLYLVATGKTTEEALRNREKLGERANLLLKNGTIQGISNAGPLLTSDSLQKLKAGRWNNYWTTEKKNQLKQNLLTEAQKYGFKPGSFSAFFSMLDKEFNPISISDLDIGHNPMVDDWLSVSQELSLAPSVLKVRESDKKSVYLEFPGNPGYVLFDKQSLTERFIENVKHDFDLLVTLSMIFVTLLLIIAFGRLGLGLISAMPMFMSWLITMGFMGFAGIMFNIFNIIVSTFIFGLGVDYSILMMRGLQHTLKTGKDILHTYKVSILLSSLTTIFGVGALLFARHPALHSIALVSVVGIVAVVSISFVFQPLAANWLFISRQRKNRFPITLRILIKTIVTWGNIILIAIFLMIFGGMINLLLPVKRKKKEMLFHHIFNRLTKAYIAFTFAYDRKLINEPGEDFTRPAIIISNHQSLIETPAFLRLYPKIIILTTTWVYKSPVFGPIARLANFYNVDLGIDNIIGLLQEKVDEGFSILIFPEAHRSEDHRIQRFHRGAFYLAEKLSVDILPVIVFGTGDFLSKGAIWGRPNSFRMKILNRVSAIDPSFGVTYQERTKQFRQVYIEQYSKFKAEEGDAHYYRRLLALNYVLKGPVLEWYMRVKMKLEDNYQVYNQLMPRHGEILDLGCGYGFISYMLMFTADGRRITGVDYDPEKIELAENCFSKNSRINFVVADVSAYQITPMMGYILSDVLHYLKPDQQDELLRKCCKDLLPGGTILVREANSELVNNHLKSKFTEFLSTRIGFNKTSDPSHELWYTSSARIEAVAREAGLRVETIGMKRFTSNTLYALRKPPAAS